MNMEQAFHLFAGRVEDPSMDTAPSGAHMLQCTFSTAACLLMSMDLNTSLGSVLRYWGQ